jgi:hypothetical protein
METRNELKCLSAATNSEAAPPATRSPDSPRLSAEEVKKLAVAQLPNEIPAFRT